MASAPVLAMVSPTAKPTELCYHVDISCARRFRGGMGPGVQAGPPFRQSHGAFAAKSRNYRTKQHHYLLMVVT